MGTPCWWKSGVVRQLVEVLPTDRGVVSSLLTTGKSQGPFRIHPDLFY